MLQYHVLARFDEPALPRLATLGVVLSAHAALGAWLLTAAPMAVTAVEPIRMDVSLIPYVAPVMAAAPSPEPVVLPLPEPLSQTDPEPLPEPEPPVLEPEPAPLPEPEPVPAPKPKPPPKKRAPRAEPRVQQPVVAPPVAVAAAAESAPTAAPAEPDPHATQQPPASPAALVEARFDADYLRNPAPVYPPMSRRRGEEGKVLLAVKVSPDGKAAHVEIRESSGFNRLDEAALRAVQGWRFVPARRGDQPVATSVVVPIIFRLDA